MTQRAVENSVRRDESAERVVRSYVIGERGELEIDLLRYQLRRDGEIVPFEPKAYDLLVYLIEHRERVVPSKELFAKFWPPHISGTVLSHYVVVARKVIGDDVDKQEMILTVRGRGYRFVGQVTERTAAHDSLIAPRIPSDLAPLAEAFGQATPISGAFIGRSEQLAQLERAVDQAFGGHGRLVLLSGEAGIGKTRLLSKLAEIAEQRGARVVSARYGDQATPAVWPLAQLNELVNDRGGVDELTRFRLFDAIAGMLRAASHERPIVLLLDDVHCADAASLALLKHLARQLENARTLLVLAFRDDCELGGITGAATRSERIALAGWTPTEVADALHEATGRRSGADDAERVHQLTGGQPRLVCELARVLAPRIAATHASHANHATM